MKRLPLAGLSGRDRRALAAGALAILLLVAGGRGLPAWLAWREEAAASAAELAFEARRVEATLRRMPRTLDSLEARTFRLLELAPALLAGEHPSAAGAELAILVSEAAAGAELRLGSLHVEADSVAAQDGARPLLARVTVRAEATGDVRGLARFLETLERGPSLISFRELAVEPRSVDSPSDRPEELRIRFTVEGLGLLRIREESP